MNAVAQNTVRTGSTNASPSITNGDSKAAAQAILNETSGKPATFDKLGQIEARIDALAQTDPEFASKVRAEIMASPRLTTVEKAQLRANAPGNTVDIDGKNTMVFGGKGKIVGWDTWINEQRKANTADYKSLVAEAKSQDNSAIKVVMQAQLDRQANAANLESAPASNNGPTGAQLSLDLVQMALDLTGIVDPTPISDGSNAVISLGRGISSLFSGEWSEAGGHVVNGAISVVGFIPGLG